MDGNIGHRGRTLLVGGGASLLDAGSDLVGQAGDLAVALEVGKGRAAITAERGDEAVELWIISLADTQAYLLAMRDIPSSWGGPRCPGSRQRRPERRQRQRMRSSL